MPAARNASKNACTGAKHPKSTVVPAQSKITASIFPIVILHVYVPKNVPPAPIRKTPIRKTPFRALPRFMLLLKIRNDLRQLFNILFVDLPDIADAECLRLRYLARIDRIAALLDVGIHFHKAVARVFRE